MSCKGPALLATLALVLAPASVAAQPVRVERPSLLDAGMVPLRWDNVEGRPYWVRGESPRWSFRAGCDLVSLEPGSSVSIILPPGTALRLHSPLGPLEATDVEVWSSDGFGLEARIEPIPSLTEPSLIVPPSPFKPSLIEVARPTSKSDPIAIALFVSRVEHRPAEDLHRTLLPLPGPVTWISSTRWLPGIRYWLLDGGAPVSVSLEGPARFALLTRLVYPDGESSASQGSTVRIAIDGRQEAFLIETTATPGGLSWIGSTTVLLGEERAAHFDLPAGRHDVEIVSALAAYARLLRRAPSDLLLSAEPAAGPPLVFGRGSPEDSLGFLLGAEARGVSRPERFPFAGAPFEGGLVGEKDRGVKMSGPEVIRILRDASRRENGLLGAMLCRDLAASLSTHPDDRATASLLYRRHAQYRSLVPLEKRTSSPQRAAWFTPRRLAAPDESPDRVRLLGEHLASAVGNLSLGLFLEAPRSHDGAHVFALPERFAPSLLRVVVERPLPPGRTDILLEADDGTRTHLRLRGDDGLDLPSAPSQAEAALGALSALHGAGGSTPHGPLADSRYPAPFVDATAVELALPASTRRVRLWAEGTSFRPRLALQYLGEKAHEPTELEYFGMLRGMEARAGIANPFSFAFQEWTRGSWPAAIPADLVNAWVPAFRAMGLARSRVLASAAAPVRPRRRVDPGDGAVPIRCAAQAASLEKSGHWLPALEAWADALAAPERETYRRARLHVVDALEALGERFLAETEIRGMLLHEEDDWLRHEALERLTALRVEGVEEASRTDILTFLATETDDPALLRELAGALVADGDYFQAIAVGLSLPEEERPIEALLRSSFKLRWWRLFDSLCEALEDSEEWSRWRGLRSAADGAHDEALRLLAAGGTRGVALERSLRAALAVRTELQARDPERRSRAVLAWEAWQTERPGPMVWVEAPSLVMSYGGTGAVYNEARNLHSQYYRAGRSGPVKIEALGPAILRIEARPIHSKAIERPLDGWLHVRERDALFPVPITGNLPARGFVVTGFPDEVPGGRIVHDIAIGPGLHEIEVGSPDVEVLARVFVREPEISLGVLPPLTPATLERALHGFVGGVMGVAGSGWVRVVLRDGTKADFPVVRIGSLAARSAPGTDSVPDPILTARIALREGSEQAISARAESLRAVLADRSLPVSERFLALSRLGGSKGPVAGADTLHAELEPRLRAAFLAAAGRLGEAIRVPGDGAGDARWRMSLLVHAAEKEPDLRRIALVLGESLFREHPGVAGLQGLYFRLARGTEWRQMEAFRDSAGVRRVEGSDPSPESPELRVRKALLSPFEDDERLVSGDGRLVVSFVNSRPVVLDLEMRLEAVEFVPRSTLRARYQVDAEEPREIVLSPEDGRRAMNLLVPEGEHAVRIWIDEPIANHYLRLRIREAGGGAPGAAGLEGSRGRRLYAISASERALRVAVQGPTTLRFDELRDGRTITSYRHLLEGLHEVALAPQGGHGEALVRVFERVEGGAGREPAPVRSLEPVPVVPAPIIDIEPPPDRMALRLEDSFALGGQEDGTFSSGASFQHVELSSEDPDASGVSNFFEGTGGFQRYHETLFTYSDTGLLGRAHLEGGPTFGFWEDLFHDGPWLPFALRLTGTGFLQWPEGGAMEPAGPPEWSLTLRGAASRRFAMGLNAYHVPSVGLFGRLLSLHDGNEYLPDTLDPDVFTEYKDDHKAGLVLSETAGYRPWLDTEWWGRVSLTSNQDLNPADPDHFSSWVGWKQYWDGWQFDVAFRAAWFFDDDDRGETRDQQTIAVQVLRNWWLAPSQRLETAVEFRHDFPDNKNSGFILIVWYFGNGRGYRDYRPGTVDFLPLRLAGERPVGENRIAEAGRE